jgi:hypothetical protein
MLRLFALLLLLANAGYFAWSQGHLRTLGWGPMEQHEPERLRQQVEADKLRVITPPPSTPAADTTAAPEPATTPQAQASTPGTPAGTCHTLAGLSPAQADVLQAALGQAGLGSGRFSREEVVLPERWIVYIGKFPSTDLMNRKKTELRSLKVDFREVGAPALQPGQALGTYSTEAAAQTALQDVGRAGVRSAKVAREREESRSVGFKLPALTPTESTTVEGLGAPLAGKALAPC